MNADNQLLKLASFQTTLVYQEDFNKALTAIKFVHDYQAICPKCLFIVAESGVGKTSLFERYIESTSTVETAELTPKPAILVKQMAALSKEAFVTALLEKLGDPDPTTGKYLTKCHRLKILKNELGLQVVIIDELHDLFPTYSVHDRSKIIVFIKWLLNDLQVSVVLGGDSRTKNIIYVDNQIKTRTTEVIERFPFSMKDDNETIRYAQFIKMIMRMYPAKINGLFSDSSEGIKRLLLATGGNNRVFKNLLVTAFKLSDSKTTISQQTLHLAWLMEASKEGDIGEKILPYKSTLNAVNNELIRLGLL